MFPYFPTYQPPVEEPEPTQYSGWPFMGRFSQLFGMNRPPVQFPTITPQTVQDFMSQVNPIYTKQQPYNSLAPMSLYQNYKKGLLDMGDKK